MGKSFGLGEVTKQPAHLAFRTIFFLIAEANVEKCYSREEGAVNMLPQRRAPCMLRQWWVLILTVGSLVYQNNPFSVRSGSWDASTMNDFYALATLAQERLSKDLQAAAERVTGSAGAGAWRFSPFYRQAYQYHSPEPRSPEQSAEFAAECGEQPAYDKFFAQGQSRRSRLKEDRIIYNTFFQDVPQEELKTYKYMEIGGYNGMDESNSRFFEACLGWDGLLVEPNPTPFKLMVKNRPHSHRASYAASCSVAEALQNKTIPFHDYPYANAAQAGTNNPYAGRRTVEVPCGPLTPVVQDLFGGHVHFFSLDVEGAEPLVLEHIDFSSVFIDILLIEVENYHCQAKNDCLSRNRTRTIMEANGYRRFEKFISASDLYVHPRSIFLSKMDKVVAQATA